MKGSTELIPKRKQTRSKAITLQEAIKKSTILLLQYWRNKWLFIILGAPIMFLPILLNLNFMLNTTCWLPLIISLLILCCRLKVDLVSLDFFNKNYKNEIGTVEEFRYNFINKFFSKSVSKEQMEHFYILKC